MTRILNAMTIAGIVLWELILTTVCIVLAALWYLGILCRAVVLLGYMLYAYVRYRPDLDDREALANGERPCVDEVTK